MRALLLILCLITVQSALAQKPGLVIDGLIYGTNGLPMKQADVTLKDADGAVMKSLKTPANGRFDFFLPFEKYMEVYVEKEGHQPKKMVFDTRNIPESERAYEYEYGGFRITMHEGDAGSEPLEVAHIQFNPDDANFVNTMR